jgi:hypothetical protein
MSLAQCGAAAMQTAMFDRGAQPRTDLKASLSPTATPFFHAAMEYETQTTKAEEQFAQKRQEFDDQHSQFSR